MRTPITALLAVVALGLCGRPADAQVLVYDSASYANLLQQAQTGLNQLNALRNQVTQAQRLYDGFNTNSGVNSLATSLSTPALRTFLPDVSAFMAAASGNTGALGQIGQQAAAIRQANRLYTPAVGDAAGQDLEQAGDRAARNLALGQQTASAGADRLTGLQQLTSALDNAPDARAVMDLQARIAAEHAMIANDQTRLQGLAMAQAAEDHLEQQRERERAAAAADARLQTLKATFQ